jgi:transcription initiation factor TFIIH subunit 4
MVQPSFSHTTRTETDQRDSPTLALDTFLDAQHQSYFEELYRSEAVCLCILRYVVVKGGKLTFRLLPPVCRRIVLHKLWSYAPLESGELKQLCNLDKTIPAAQ